MIKEFSNNWKNYSSNLLVESGIEQIRRLSKQYNEAEIWFHVDLDGVVSAIAMKAYLGQYGIKTTAAYTIQYGEKEYSAHAPTPGKLYALVDYAHGKPFMHIHTDHHDLQTGVVSSTKSLFTKAKSNAATISQKVAPYNVFPPDDIEIVNMVDSAGFLERGLSPEEVAQSVFKLSNESGLDKNKINLGLVVNRMLLSHKNRAGFLEEVVMKSNPSLLSMYTVIQQLISTPKWTKYNFGKKAYDTDQTLATGKEIEKNHQQFVLNQMKRGDTYLIGEDVKVVMQWNGGASVNKPGSYDRYTAFQNFPEADYICSLWSMGIVQVSKNPFKKSDLSLDLGEFMWEEVMPIFIGPLTSLKVSLYDIKMTFEKKLTPESMGFNFQDLMALYGDLLSLTSEQTSYLEEILAKNKNQLTPEDVQILQSVDIPAWEIVRKSSGGHFNITTISGLEFLIPQLKDKFIDLLKRIWIFAGEGIVEYFEGKQLRASEDDLPFEE